MIWASPQLHRCSYTSVNAFGDSGPASGIRAAGRRGRAPSVRGVDDGSRDGEDVRRKVLETVAALRRPDVVDAAGLTPEDQHLGVGRDPVGVQLHDDAAAPPAEVGAHGFDGLTWAAA